MDFLSMDIMFFMIGVILIYIPFHLFEEALGNFPKWMYEHKWTPERLTYGHWMANNIFFYFSLLIIGFTVYFFTDNRCMFIGVGIIFWGLINCFDHIIYTIIDRKISPGIFTGFIFGAISIIALLKLYSERKLNLKLIALSILMGLIYAFVPVMLSIIFSKKFKKIFR